jgi:hypothetical protein
MFQDTKNNKSSVEMELVFYLLLFVNLVFLVKWVYRIGTIYLKKVEKRLYKTIQKDKSKK